MTLLNIVQQAIAAGFGEEEILGFLSNRIPNLEEGIQKAHKSGFSPSRILRFLSSTLPKRNQKDAAKQENINDQYLSSIGLKTREEREAQRSKVLKGTLGVGAGVLGAIGLSRGLPALARSGIGQNLLSKVGLGSTTSHAQPDIMPEEPVQSNESAEQKNTEEEFPQNKEGGFQQPSPQEQANQNLHHPQQSPLNKKLFPSPEFQPGTPRAALGEFNKRKAHEIIDKLGIKETVNNLSKSSKNLEEISRDVINSLTPEKKEEYTKLYRSGESKPMIGLLRDYLANPLTAAAPEPVAKTGDIVAGPNGIVGEIKSSRNGKALIESEGKLHQMDADDLITSPIPEKDLAELHEDLMRGIEKKTGENVSQMVNFAGYDPNSNSLAFLPHEGGLYIYDNIPEEEVKLLTNVLNTRKTSGENFIGAWKAGTKSPIGAAMSDLIKRLQSKSGGKGKEYSRKYPTVYSALEPAIKAAKESKKKRRKSNEK